MALAFLRTLQIDVTQVRKTVTQVGGGPDSLLAIR